MTAGGAEAAPNEGRATLWTCEPGWETPLADELRRTAPAASSYVAGRGRVASVGGFSVGAGEDPAVAFASQTLPEAELCRAPSIAQWSQEVCARIVRQLDDSTAPWRLHVFALPSDAAWNGWRRGALIRERIVADLRETKRRLARRLVSSDEADWADDEALVQVCLASPEQGFVSTADADRRRTWRRCLSRFAGGFVAPAEDKLAPSRAFAKLVEAERRLGRSLAAGETCVDLGSAPGSWAYTALRRGAKVTAVDRSPLRDDLMRDPGLTFVRGDAFAYVPSSPVDWLLSDVVAFPMRVRTLLAEWLGAERCRYFCVTVKFRGRDDDAALEDVKALLRSVPYDFALRRLSANKNEATAYGYAKSESPRPLC